jgi:Phage gp6-like head-tail connector protein
MSNQVISIDRSESSPTEPVTPVEAKAHLILTTTDDDTLLTSLITRCRKAVENFCHISIARQQITAVVVFDSESELPYGPVTDIISVGTSQSNTGSGPVGYDTATSGWQTDGGGFKTFDGGCSLRYRIVYMAGYTVVPEDLKLAVLNEIAFRYENRGEANDLHETGICAATRMLALPYKRMLWI